MPNSLLLSQADIVHPYEWPEPSESAEQTSTAVPVRSILRLIVNKAEPFELRGQLLSDRSVDLRSATWSTQAADVAQEYSRTTIPPWITSVVESVQALRRLPENWDSYGARPLATKSIENLMYLLWQGIQLDVTAPSVVPTVRGGIQLEWHQQGIDLEIEIPPSGRLLVSYEDIETGRDWEGEINLWDNVLPSFLELLARGRNERGSRE
jgi:hypothetical protein